AEHDRIENCVRHRLHLTLQNLEHVLDCRAGLCLERSRDETRDIRYSKTQALEIPLARDAGNIPRIPGSGHNGPAVARVDPILVARTVPVELHGNDTRNDARQPRHTLVFAGGDDERVLLTRALDSRFELRTVCGL